MSWHVVPNHDISRAQLRGEKMLDVELKYLSVNRPFDHHRSPHSIEGQRANDGNISAGFERLDDHGAFPARRARIRTRHRQMDAEFIQEPQPQRRQSHLFLGEGRPLLRAGFPGAAGLFLSVKSICCKPRQIVLILTLTRQRRRSNSRSSSKVASGNSATNPANSSNMASSNFNGAPPPWGNGERSPISRRNLKGCGFIPLTKCHSP